MKKILVFSIVFFCALSAYAQFSKVPDIPYAEDSERQKLDLYLPDNPTENRPIVLWIHGGAWIVGDKNPIPFHARTLLGRGYAVASLNYRFLQDSMFPAQIHDCKAAVRWIRANASDYGIIAEKIGVWGGSAGGHLSALLGTSAGVEFLEGDLGNAEYSSAVQAACDYYGPTDLSEMSAEQHSGEIIKEFFRQYPDSASPVFYVDSNDPPFLIFHGTNDPLVPYRQSIKLDSILKYRGVESELVLIPGAGHGGSEFQSDSVLRKIWRFFDRHIKSAISVEESDEDRGFKIYPNPADDKVFLALNQLSPTISVQLVNVLGEIMLNKKIKACENPVRLDISSLPNGVYCVRAFDGKHCEKGIFVKK